MNISPLSPFKEPSPISSDIEDILSYESLLIQISQNEEDTFLSQHGYKKIRKISNTLQGDIWECEIISDNISSSMNQQMQSEPKHVAIKRTDKYLYHESISVENNFNFIVSENIIKESVILKHLTNDNQPIGDSIVKYIDFFESETDYYLIQELITSEYSLTEFVQKAHQYIRNGQLDIKSYQKIVKFIFWQISVAIQWMHHDMNCMFMFSNSLTLKCGIM